MADPQEARLRFVATESSSSLAFHRISLGCKTETRASICQRA